MNPEAALEPDALRAALTYAARGWPVAPAHSIRDDRSCTCSDVKCTSRGKHPLTPHGLKDASTDEATIRSWWSKWPHANVLIRTGMVGDRCLVALDIDPRHNGDESLAKLIIEHGELPATPQCCTGGGGQHIFMWAPRAIPNSAGKAGDERFGEGVDVRGEGGYVIAAPSRHESGRTYEWDSGAHPADVTLAEAPAWFVHLAGWSKKRRDARDGDDVGNDESYIVGGRNDALTRLGGAMRRVGAGLKRITDALLDENDEKCKPPLDPAEVKKIARSVVKYPSGDPTPAGVDPFPMLTASDLATELPPVPWVCEALGIAPGAVTIIGGAGFGGKTISMQALALAVASGKKLWGYFEARKGRAVHIDYEQGRRLTQDRYQRLSRGMSVDLAELGPHAFGVSCLPRGKLDDKQAEDHLVRICEGAAVAIVDAFRGAFPSAKENDSESRKYLDMLQQASERTGCAMLVIAHSRKANDDEDVRSSLRGSGALFDAAQTVYMLDGAPKKPTRVHNTKDRILGESRDTFGLTIKDDIGGPDLIARWALCVEYMHPSQVHEIYSSTDDRDDDNSFAMNAERLRTLTVRVFDVIARSGANGCPGASISSMLRDPVRDLNAAYIELERQGSIRRDGNGARAIYTAVARLREAGED